MGGPNFNTHIWKHGLIPSKLFVTALELKMMRWHYRTRTLYSYLRNNLPYVQRGYIILERRTLYPKVQVLGRWVHRPAKTDPLVREIQEAVIGLTMDRQVTSGTATLVDGQSAEKNPLTGWFQQPSQLSVWGPKLFQARNFLHTTLMYFQSGLNWTSSCI